MPFYPTSSSGGGGGGGNLKRIGADLDYATLASALANGDGDRAFVLMADETLTADLEIPATWTEFYCAINPGVTLAFADNTFGVASGGTTDVTFEGLCRETSILSRVANSGDVVFQGAGNIGRITLANLTLTSTSTTSGDGWIDDTDTAPTEITVDRVTVACGNHRYPFITNESSAKLTVRDLILDGGGTSCGDALRVQGSRSAGTTALIDGVRIEGSWVNSSVQGAINVTSAEAEYVQIKNVTAETDDNLGIRIDGYSENISLLGGEDADVRLGGEVRGLYLNTGDTTPDVTVDASTTIRDSYIQTASFTFSQGATDSPKTRIIDSQIPAGTTAGGGVEFVRVNDMGSFGHATLDAELNWLQGYFDFTEGAGPGYVNSAPRPRIGEGAARSGVASSSAGPDGNGFATSDTVESVSFQAPLMPHLTTTEFTINFWVEVPDATPASGGAFCGFSPVSGPYNGLGVFLLTSGELAVYSSGTGGNIATSTGGPQMSDGVMSMVSFVRRNVAGTPTFFIYVDAVEIASGTTGNLATLGYRIHLSRFSQADEGMAGDYAALSVWSKALSTSAISALYNSGSGRFLGISP